MKPRVLNLILTHQGSAQVERTLAWWRGCVPAGDVLVAFNGREDVFDALPHPHKIRVEDPRLRTRDHVRERQSYTAVWQAASRWLTGREYTHVHFAEYDCVPLVDDLNVRQVARLEQERADVLCYQLQRVDGTNWPHVLAYGNEPGFAAHWREISVRADRQTVLSMLGSSSFWTRAAFDAVAARDEPFPMYLEIYLPTLAHHLGYRLRDWGDQNRHVRNLGEFADRIEQARRDGAWTLHPVKTLWNDPGR